MQIRALLAVALAGAAASGAAAQVVINEVYENPPGSGAQFDDRYEYIELYGAPGLDLTGYAVAVLKGGADPNDDGIPGPRPPGFDPGDEVPEIDEAFSLDGLSLGSNGFLVIYNNNGAPALPSLIPQFLPPETNRATFAETHIPSVDTVGRLNNDGSSTYVLVRRRPFHEVENGQSVYLPGYAWRKDVNQDVNFDGVPDFGFEQPVVYPIFPIPAASQIQPYQMVDEVAWSHRGGQEYIRTRQNEISDTPGYNPDAISRLYYFLENPLIGHRFNSSGELRNTRQADEEWVHGGITEVNPRFNYDNGVNSDGFIQAKGPTDPDGPLYDGTCDPDDPNVFCPPNPNGTLRFDDINLVGFRLTPGDFNDVDSTAVGGIDIRQFRFVRGDFNFDGVVDQQDLDLIIAHLGATLDDRTLCLDDGGLPVVNPDTFETYDCYAHEGRAFNQVIAMLNMDTTDGPGGDNAPEVTERDVAATARLICPADFAQPFGQLDIFDILAFLAAFEAGDESADLAAPFGQFDIFDILAFLDLFEQGCP